MMTVNAFLDVMPAFTFTKYPNGKKDDVIMSFPALKRLSGGRFKSVLDIPLKEVLFHFKPGTTKDQRQSVVRDLLGIIDGDETEIYWYDEQIDGIDLATEILSLFFGFATLVVMFICFFSLVSSMFTNVTEQAKEIGILLALGVNKNWLRRIYIYEAFILVLSSSVLGIAIGVLISWTMTIQQVLFTQTPVPFVLPYGQTILVFILSILFAIFSSWGPINLMLRQNIVKLMKSI